MVGARPPQGKGTPRASEFGTVMSAHTSSDGFCLSNPTLVFLSGCCPFAGFGFLTALRHAVAHPR
jgi:hypothetical protein